MGKRLLLLMGSVVFLGIAICCGGGGDGDSDNNNDGTCVNAAGTWNMTERVDATDCRDGTYNEEITYTVTQSDCNITVVPSTNPSLRFSGSISGKKISWKGSWPEEGGTTTADVNATIDGDSISGSASWSWTDGTDSCEGTTQITGTRVDAGNGAETASVRFYNNLRCNNNNFTAILTVCGQTFTSLSGDWSSCDDITPGTCTVSYRAQTGGCGTLSNSYSHSFEEGLVYNFALNLEGNNHYLGINVQSGGCSTNTPWRTGASELGVNVVKIETVMDTFESHAGLQSIDSQ
jgi:hypothetical protein